MAAQKDPMKDALGFLHMEIPPPDLAGVTVAMDAPPLPDYQRKLPMEEAEKLREAIPHFEATSAETAVCWWAHRLTCRPNRCWARK